MLRTTTTGLRFCIILCTHNGSKFLNKQLDSIFQQSHKPTNLYIADWGSTDNTKEIAIQASNLHKQIQIEIESFPDAPGPAASFLRATQRAVHYFEDTTDYYCFCDQDDIWVNTKLETISRAIAEASDTPDIGWSNVSLIDANENEIPQKFYGRTYRNFPKKVDGSIFFFNPVIGMTLFARNSFTKRFSRVCSKRIIMHDWAILLFTYLTKANTISIDLPLVRYRQHESNIIGANKHIGLATKIRKSKSHIKKIYCQIQHLRETTNVSCQPKLLELLATPYLKIGRKLAFTFAIILFKPRNPK